MYTTEFSRKLVKIHKSLHSACQIYWVLKIIDSKWSGLLKLTQNCLTLFFLPYKVKAQGEKSGFELYKATQSFYKCHFILNLYIK